jgi:NAD(P)-dependent dehydrogenase (short-subunit alcohol dehydrogenase family)
MTVKNPFSLEGKTILVTGASSGIGRAVAIECSRAGGSIIISGRNEDRLQETFESLYGDGHGLIVADLTVENELEMVSEVAAELDGIVHVAGILKYVPIQFVTQMKLNEAFSVNFFAPSMLSQKLIRKKKIKRGASVVFISSINGVYCSFVASSIYSSTKGALNGLVKGMALDLADKQIRVNSVCPGMIETGLLREGEITEDQITEDKKKYPLKRYGKPEEVAYAVIYLLSDASGWVTGTNLLIDGGYTLL